MHLSRSRCPIGHPADRSPLLLQFEAQRPIDTTALQHGMHFSHFSITNSLPGPGQAQPGSGTYTTIANFSFVRPEDALPSQELPYAPEPPQRRGTSFRTVASDGVVAAEQPQQSLYNIHEELAGRLQPTQHMSSIIDTNGPPSPRRERSHSRAMSSTAGSSLMGRNRSTSSARGDPNGFTFVAAPLSMREESSSASSSFPPSAFEAAPFPFLQQNRWRQVDPATIRTRSRAPSEGMMPSPPSYRQALDVTLGYGLESQGASIAGMDRMSRSRSNSGRNARSTSRVPAALKPAYGFQLDPLDSFETWILTLSIRRVDHDLTPAFGTHRQNGGACFMRPFETERRIMEGLERVYREWFRPPVKYSESQEGDLSGLINANSVTSARSKARLYQADMTDTERERILPPARMLEVDSKPACQLRIQPHPCEKFAEHPALSGASGSHGWLSYSSFAGAGASFPQVHNNGRIELTFHCEGLQVNAALLLSAFEMVEKDLYAKKANAKLQAALSDENADVSHFITEDNWAAMRLGTRKGGGVYIDDYNDHVGPTIIRFV